MAQEDHRARGRFRHDARRGGDAPVPVVNKKTRPTALTAILDAAFEAAMTPKLLRQLHAAKAVALIVQVPTANWVQPVAGWFGTTFGERWTRVVRESTAASKTAAAADIEAARALARGLCVVGISADVGSLPATLVGAADITIVVAPPTTSVVRAAIAQYTGRAAGELPAGAGDGLDLPDIVAAFRPGAGHRKIGERLIRAAGATSGVGAATDVPVLATALEYGEARTWGMSLAADIASYRAGTVAWSELPRGIILSGPPGTGKTLFSRSLAAACGLPLVATSVADLFTQGSRGHLDDIIRAFGVFMDKAQSLAPSIGFIDEIDGIPNRATVSGHHNGDFWKPFVNYVLTRLDNSFADNRKGIIIIGATNDARDLDPALTRPGRLERIVEIVPPDAEGVTNIIRFHAPELAGEDLGDVADMAERSTGAEIMLLVREAKRIARLAGRPLTVADLRLVLLPAGSIPPEVLRRISAHEAGHATAALALNAGRVRRCMVTARGRSGGHTLIEPLDGDLVTRSRVERDVIVLLAGRSAERLTHVEISGGATRDLEESTRLVAALHASSGLGDTITFLAPYGAALEAMRFDRDLQRRVERDLQALQSRADELIVVHRRAVEAIASALGVRRHLSEREIRAHFDANPPAVRRTNRKPAA
ncbi:AAA family ATPase [Tardiphaga alba]|uniref:AAA family ATPase n=1 Tax=Tardiphaga alba TaxID=340268 RepID=A0ABX8A2W3_9BRAD|nr:AAA family ATPase [Tardiphaga alba]